MAQEGHVLRRRNENSNHWKDRVSNKFTFLFILSSLIILISLIQQPDSTPESLVEIGIDTKLKCWARKPEGQAMNIAVIPNADHPVSLHLGVCWG